jgi:DNA/RNA-binding domain of Phe-tRNA-synthetase-like protein
MSAQELELGWVAADVQAEFPELRLWSVRHEARPGRSTPGLRERLRALSSRFYGAQAVQLRTDPIPHAYRVFYRHVGLDPDTERTPVEAAVVNRLLHGGFRSRGLVEDALLVAVAETGVPLWALDEGTLDGTIGIRMATDTESLGRGEYASDARPGRLVVADQTSPVAELFADPQAGHAPGEGTEVLRIYAVQVAGVPAIHVEEAFWLASEALDTAR